MVRDINYFCFLQFRSGIEKKKRKKKNIRIAITRTQIFFGKKMSLKPKKEATKKEAYVFMGMEISQEKSREFVSPNTRRVIINERQRSVAFEFSLPSSNHNYPSFSSLMHHSFCIIAQANDKCFLGSKKIRG